VVDAASGAVVFEDHADEVSPPASMTKLMTFAVLNDAIQAGRLSLQTPITVAADDARVGMLKDSTSVWLRKGEVFPVEELIYAMMIQSANDAAYAVARTVSGSVPAFVGAMNGKARSLGMTRTIFRTPNGLPVRSHRIADGDLTTPRDFSLLARYLVTHTDILKYTAVKSRVFGAGRRFPPTQMTNHNHLLGKFSEVDGLKTGFTNGAGFCLTATAHRAGRRIIVVVMDCPDSRDRDLAVAQLIQTGLALKPFVQPTIASPPAPASAPSPAGPASTPPIRFAVPPGP
jgi:D-alanyl-D-alanine carboxypeptidase (penicillin-binding protein 5/6)